MEQPRHLAAVVIGLTLIAASIIGGEAGAGLDQQYTPLIEQARSITDQEQRTQTLTEIGKVMCQSFPKGPGIRVLQEAHTSSLGIISAIGRSIQQYGIATGLARECGAIEEATRLAKGIDDATQRVNVLLAIERFRMEAEKESIAVSRPKEEQMRRTLEQTPPFFVNVENRDEDGQVKQFAHGFIADARGYVFTNAHLDTGGRLWVIHGGKEYQAEIVSRLGGSDILLLRLHSRARSLPAAPLSETPELLQNETVLGTVCGPSRDIRKRVGIFEKSLYGGRAFSTDFRADGIEQGCSGAPLLNANREVVGMLYGVSPNDRFGYAKPSTELLVILKKVVE